MVFDDENLKIIRNRFCKLTEIINLKLEMIIRSKIYEVQDQSERGLQNDLEMDSEIGDFCVPFLVLQFLSLFVDEWCCNFVRGL